MSYITAIKSTFKRDLHKVDLIDTNPEDLTRFHCKNLPKLGISQFIDRLEQYLYCSEEVFVIACIYIDRVKAKQPWMVFNTSSMYRLLLVAAITAAKFFDDEIRDNFHYARVGGISNRELNELELLFLEYIDFDLYIQNSEYEDYSTTLRKNCRQQKQILDDALSQEG